MLQRISPALRATDFATTTLPSIAAARDGYEALRAERDRVGAVHAAYDDYAYHTERNGGDRVGGRKARRKKETITQRRARTA